MIIKKLSLLIGVTALASSSLAFALIAIPTITPASSSSNTENRGYVGLKWTLGNGLKPAAVVGYRHARINTNGDTNGSDISFSFGLLDGFQASKLGAKYFNGHETTQGEIGGGYDFANGIFAGVGIKAPYSNFGVDYSFSKASPWQPYLMLDTLKKYDTPKQSCPTGYTLSGNFCH